MKKSKTESNNKALVQLQEYVKELKERKAHNRNHESAALGAVLRHARNLAANPKTSELKDALARAINTYDIIQAEDYAQRTVLDRLILILKDDTQAAGSVIDKAYKGQV